MRSGRWRSSSRNRPLPSSASPTTSSSKSANASIGNWTRGNRLRRAPACSSRNIRRSLGPAPRCFLVLVLPRLRGTSRPRRISSCFPFWRRRSASRRLSRPTRGLCSPSVWARLWLFSRSARLHDQIGTKPTFDLLDFTGRQAAAVGKGEPDLAMLEGIPGDSSHRFSFFLLLLLLGMDRGVVFLAWTALVGGDCRRQDHRQRSVRAMRMVLPASQVITIAWSLFFVRFLMGLFGIVLGYRGRTGTGRGQDGRDGTGRGGLNWRWRSYCSHRTRVHGQLAWSVGSPFREEGRA